jgi:hypothetical protein
MSRNPGEKTGYPGNLRRKDQKSWIIRAKK